MNNKDFITFSLFFLIIGAWLGVVIYTWNSEIATNLFFVAFGVVMFFCIGRVFNDRSFKLSVFFLKIAISILVVRYSGNLVNLANLNIVIPKTVLNQIWATYPWVLTALLISAIWEIIVIVKNRKR